jgi:uncharacterized membrane-anchored protein YhcB (DUF1043 family)
MSKKSSSKKLRKSFWERLKATRKTQRKLEKRLKFLEKDRKEFTEDFRTFQLMTMSLSLDFSDFKYHYQSPKKTTLEENQLIN